MAKRPSDSLTKHHLGIVITGILCCLGPTTMIFNTWSIFMVPVSESLGVGTDAFAVMPSLIFLTCVLAAPLAGKLLDRFDARLVLTGACVLAGATIFCCSFMTELWQLYAAGILEGLAGVVLMFLMLPTMVNRWFAKNVATVIGICVAMTGVGGAIWVMVGGMIMVVADWHIVYMVFGVIAVLISVPATLFLVRSHPSDCGVEPYGLSELRSASAGCETDIGRGAGAGTGASVTGRGSRASKHGVKVSDPSLGVSAKVAFGSASFVLMVLAFSLLNGVLQVGNLFPTYVYYLGDLGVLSMDAAALVIAASTVGLCLQVAQAFGKVTLGIIGDRSVTAAFVAALISGLLGLACVRFGCAVPLIIYAGGLLYGFFYAIVDVLAPAMSREFFGQREYTTIYARVASFINIVPAFSTAAFGALSAISWDLTFGVVVIVQVLVLVLGVMAIRLSKNLPHTRD